MPRLESRIIHYHCSVKKKIIEVKFSKQKFSKKVPILTNVCSQLNPDNTLLLIFLNWAKKTIASPWFKS